MTALPVIVAIPARNEADRIGACLAALAAQPGARHSIAGVTVFANNCTDDTIFAAQAQEMPFPLQVMLSPPICRPMRRISTTPGAAPPMQRWRSRRRRGLVTLSLPAPMPTVGSRRSGWRR